jgi:hypothetical protein
MAKPVPAGMKKGKAMPSDILNKKPKPRSKHV